MWLPDKERWEAAEEEEESQADSAGLLWYPACVRSGAGGGGGLGVLPKLESCLLFFMLLSCFGLVLTETAS